MATPRDQLYDMAEEAQNESSTPQQNDTTEAVIQKGLEQFFSKQKEEQAQAEQQERQRAFNEKQLMEQQELEQSSEAVKKALQEETAKDSDFSKLVESSELPASLINYIAEVGAPDEAAGIVREFANNDEYKKQFQNARSNIGRKRVLSKVRKDVLTGGYQGNIPDMLKKSVPQYNQNASPQNFDDDYYDSLALSCGIC